MTVFIYYLRHNDMHHFVKHNNQGVIKQRRLCRWAQPTHCCVVMFRY